MNFSLPMYETKHTFTTIWRTFIDSSRQPPNQDWQQFQVYSISTWWHSLCFSAMLNSLPSCTLTHSEHYMTHYMWHCTQRAHYTAVCGTAAKGEVEDYIPVHNKQGGPSPVVSTTKVWHAKSQQDSVLGIVVPMLCAWSSSCGGGLHIHSPNSISRLGLPLPRRAACVPASYMLL